jgi:hypothetical protein
MLRAAGVFPVRKKSRGGASGVRAKGQRQPTVYVGVTKGVGEDLKAAYASLAVLLQDWPWEGEYVEDEVMHAACTELPVKWALVLREYKDRLALLPTGIVVWCKDLAAREAIMSEKGVHSL